MKKIISILLCLSLLFAMATLLASCNTTTEDSGANTPDTPNTDNNTDDSGDEPVDQQALDYASALAAIESGDYEAAKALFEKLGDYLDAKTYLSKFYYMPISVDYNMIDKKGTNEIVYNDKNLPANEIVAREDAQGGSEFFYDENGNFVKQVVSNLTTGEVSSYEYFYENGKFVAALGLFAGGTEARHTYEYDENGYLIKETYEDNAGNEYEYLFSYDENGYLIKQTGTYNGYYDEATITYTFDENGRVKRELRTYTGGVQESKDYTYDENGNNITYIYTYYDGDQDRYDYEYDSNGNMIHETFTNYKGVVQTVKMTYKLFYVPTGLTEGTVTFFTTFWGDRI